MSTKLRPQRKIVIRNSGLKKGGVKKQQPKRTGRKGHIPDPDSTDNLLTFRNDEEKQQATTTTPLALSQENPTVGEPTTTMPTAASTAIVSQHAMLGGGGGVFRFVSSLFQSVSNVSLPLSIDGPLGLGLLPLSASARMDRIKQIAKDQKRSDQDNL